MPTSPTSISFFPDKAQAILLKTVLSKGETSRKLWQEWNSIVDFDRLDYDTCCVIPSVYKKLVKYQIDTQYLALIKGLSRKFWCKNQLLYTQFHKLIPLFNSENLDFIAIRGVAINLAYYQSDLIRPVEEIDLLIDTARIDKFRQVLLSNNWQEVTNSPLENTWRFVHPQTSVKLDLYRYLLTTGLEENINDNSSFNSQIAQQTRSFSYKNNEIKILAPEIQLLQILLQGTNPNFVSPYRWVMDAYQIVNSTADFDRAKFDRSLNLIEQKTTIISMLDYLESSFDVKVN